MIIFKIDNIFNQNTQAIINPVNINWIMWWWLAKDFKDEFPKNYLYYKYKCINKQFSIWDLLLFKEKWKIIINFPTKKNYWENSRLEYITLWLETLKKKLKQYNIESVAIPKLWSWLWWLNWEIVKEEIIKQLNDLVDIEIVILEY